MLRYCVEQIKGFDGLGEVILQWQTASPTREGWYWAKTKRGIYCARLAQDIGLPEKLYFESVNMYWEEGMEWFDITHWLGPLPEPAPPTEGE